MTSPSLAKNQMARALRGIISPKITGKMIAEIWTHFESKCAYCEATIVRESRTGHLDHLESQSAANANNSPVLVLACAKCNGDEKREKNWHEFLIEKSKNEIASYKRRLEKIKFLINKNINTKQYVNNNTYLIEAVELIIKEQERQFNMAVEKIRSLLKESKCI